MIHAALGERWTRSLRDGTGVRVGSAAAHPWRAGRAPRSASTWKDTTPTTHSQALLALSKRILSSSTSFEVVRDRSGTTSASSPRRSPSSIRRRSSVCGTSAARSRIPRYPGATHTALSTRWCVHLACRVTRSWKSSSPRCCMIWPLPVLPRARRGRPSPPRVLAARHLRTGALAAPSTGCECRQTAIAADSGTSTSRFAGLVSGSPRRRQARLSLARRTMSACVRRDRRGPAAHVLTLTPDGVCCIRRPRRARVVALRQVSDVSQRYWHHAVRSATRCSRVVAARSPPAHVRRHRRAPMTG